MNKFVTAILWLLGGLMAAVAPPTAATPRTTTQEPIPTPVWTVEDVATSGYANALAVDSFGRPHLLYDDPVSGALRYAVREHDGWHFEDVANESIHMPYLDYDLQIGLDGAPCLVYATEKPVAGQPFDTRLVYGCRGQNGWELTAIEDGGRGPSLAFDDSEPHIALVQGRDAVYLTREGNQWRKEIAGSDDDYMNQVFLMLSGTGWPTLIYRGAAGQYRADRDWDHTWSQTRLADPTIYALYRTDYDDSPWLAVNDGEAAWGHPPFFLARLKLVGPEDTGTADWETIAEAYDWQIAVDLAADPFSGDTVMAFIDPVGALQYLWWDEDGRHTHSPRARGDSEVSLALMSNDDLQFIAFADANQLKLATRRIVAFDNWQYAPVVVGSPGG